MSINLEPSDASTVTAIVVDDDPLVRRVLHDSLERGGMRVVAEAATGLEGIRLTSEHRPDIVLMDVVLPDLDGIAATQAIRQEVADQCVVLLTGAGHDDLVVNAMKAGAAGYLTKDLPLDALPRALRAVLEGEPAISRRSLTRLIDHLRAVPNGQAGLRPVAGPLTGREWEVVELLGQGLTNEQIATRLVVSIETVRSHVKNILRKLDVRSRRAAVEKAERLRTVLE